MNDLKHEPINLNGRRFMMTLQEIQKIYGYIPIDQDKFDEQVTETMGMVNQHFIDMTDVKESGI